MELPSQNGGHEAGSSSDPCAAPTAGPDTLNESEMSRMAACSSRDFDFGLKSPPIWSSSDWWVLAVVSLLFSFLLEYLFFSFLVFKFCMCLFHFHVPQVTFLNICICWTIAYFFNSPTPEKYIWFMCIVYKEKRKRGKKKNNNKKYHERKKKTT